VERFQSGKVLMDIWVIRLGAKGLFAALCLNHDFQDLRIMIGVEVRAEDEACIGGACRSGDLLVQFMCSQH